MVEAEGEQDWLEVSTFTGLCATCLGEMVEVKREQDRLEVSSFLDSVQHQESWWRQRESKTGWR